jgi:hypothetical protein
MSGNVQEIKSLLKPLILDFDKNDNLKCEKFNKKDFYIFKRKFNKYLN